MDDRFSVQEVIEIAIEIEKNGIAFYGRLTESADTVRLRDLFAYLAEEEKRHVATQYMGYMKALADERVFKSDISVAEVADRARSPREAIDIAIGFEKESVLFLHEMWELVRESDREAIQKLLDEERDHVRRLSAIKTQMSL
jgi:rubrerythrin